MATRAEFQKNFSDFLEATKVYLGFLIRHFGFSFFEPHFAKYKCFFDFQRSDYRVGLTYELTSIPFCQVRQNVDGKWETISMNKLFARAAHTLTPTQIKSIKSDLKKEMDSALVAYGKLIQGYLNQSANNAN